MQRPRRRTRLGCVGARRRPPPAVRPPNRGAAMRRNSILSTIITTALTAAAVASAAPASAEAVVYDTKNVKAVEPGNPPESAEWAGLDIPTGYTRQRLDWHTVGFFENHGG